MKQMLAVDRRGVAPRNVSGHARGCADAFWEVLPGARASASCSTVAGTTTCTYTQDDTFTVPPGVAPGDGASDQRFPAATVAAAALALLTSSTILAPLSWRVGVEVRQARVPR